MKMVLTLKEAHSKRRCQLGFLKTTFVVVLFIWFICLFYEIYEIRKTESEELNLLHGHHIRHNNEDQKHLQSSINNADVILDKLHSFSPNANHSNKSHGRKRFRVVNKDSDINRRKGQINFPPSIRNIHSKKHPAGSDHSISKDFAALTNRTYVEFDWNLKEPGTKRMTISPGGRWEKPHLGENGTPVKIDPSDLDLVERTEYNVGWVTHKFNEYVSKRISLQRDVPDYREPECGPEFDHNRATNRSLPAASVIICFYNEAWSVLQRTVYSVLLRSPPHLVKEIILVDDHSNLDQLKTPLGKFVAKTDKLRLLRMTNRTGLVKARLAGINAAHGPVLIFLDSHVECQEGWIEPLLQTVAKNPRIAVTPQIDVISEKTFSISKANGHIGILDFDVFSFNWGPIMPRIARKIKTPTDPFESPTMAGGLFAIRKDFFLALGTYDPGLAIWGGENIELSLKLWLCGGGILIHPCSRVSHIFRDSSPYLTGKLVNVGSRNSARVAFVWADEYKHHYFKDKTFEPDEWEHIKKDIQERIDLRKQLGCKSFHWYLENVYPEMYVEGTGKYMGPIQSWSNGLCIQEDYDDAEVNLFLVDCHDAIPWESSRLKEIRFKQHCISTYPEQPGVFSSDCEFDEETQSFEYNPKEQIIYHPASNRCLTVGPDGDRIYCMPCRRSSPEQRWMWSLNTGEMP